MIFNDTEIKNPEFIYELTYNQCYNYFNWKGPVRVPGVCQYAHTLAYFVGETYKEKTTHHLL